MFAGMASTYTAFKDGAYSITLNQREPKESLVDLYKNMVLLFAGVNQVGWSIRDTMTQCKDY